MSARRKPKAWTPPAGLKIEVGVFRGDVSLKAEATAADALNVARLLVAMVRQLAKDAPDILPHADTVPGGVMEMPWYDVVEDRARVGFRVTERVTGRVT